MDREKDISEAVKKLSDGDPHWDWGFGPYDWRDALACTAEVIAAVSKAQSDRIADLERKLAERN